MWFKKEKEKKTSEKQKLQKGQEMYGCIHCIKYFLYESGKYTPFHGRLSDIDGLCITPYICDDCNKKEE